MNPAEITQWTSLILQMFNISALLYAFSRFATKPNRTQDSRLDELEAWRVRVDERLETDHKQFKDLSRDIAMTLQSQLVIMDALISGDNKEELLGQRNTLYKHLSEGRHYE